MVVWRDTISAMNTIKKRAILVLWYLMNPQFATVCVRQGFRYL